MASIATYRNAVLIYNPNAGTLRHGPGLMEAIRACLTRSGHAVELRPTAGPNHATRLAAESAASGVELILAAGGDGTINEVVNGMVGSAATLGVVPLGTANVLAREMRMPRNPLETVSRLASFEPVRIGVGALKDIGGGLRRHFVLMAGAGLDAHIVAHLNPAMKRRFGKGAYWSAGFQSLARPLEELNARCEGRAVRCSFALASRVRNYGGNLEIARGASLLSDGFEVMLFEGSNPLRYLKYFTGVLLGRAARLRGITALQTRELILEPLDGVKAHIQLDGEDCGVVPARVEFIPDALTLLMPGSFLSEERKRWTT